MIPETEKAQILRRSVIDNVNIILLNSTFADKIVTSQKLYDLTVFGLSDIELIKEGIAAKFGLNIDQDISNFSIGQLHTMVFLHVRNSDTLTEKFMDLAFRKQKPISVRRVSHPQATQSSLNTNPKWDRNYIFSQILKKIKDAYQDRSIQSRDKISDLITRAQNTGMDTTPLEKALKELEQEFDITITYDMKIYNIGNLAEESWIAQGKAVDSRVERAEMDSYWAPLHDALAFKYLKNVLNTDFGVNISTYKLCHAKSYEEYVKLIQDAQQRKADRLKKHGK